MIIVASVSCIYGLGSPEAYQGMLLYLEEGMEKDRRAVLSKMVEILYERNDIDFHRGTFRVRGDRVEIFPAYEEDGQSASSSGATPWRPSGRSTPCGPDDPQAQKDYGLPGLPLRHHRPNAAPGHGRHRGGIGRAPHLVPGAG